MIKRFFKWCFYGLAFVFFLVVILFAVAYWKREAILQEVNGYLSEQINGEIEIGKLDFTLLYNFPQFSITLHDVSLRGPQYTFYHHDFFSAKKIYLNIGLRELLKKEINIKSFTLDDANIFIFHSRSGYTNLDIFKKQKDTLTSTTNEEPFLYNIKKVEFRQVNFLYVDSVKNKTVHFQFLKTAHTVSATDSLFGIGIAGKMHFDELTLNAANGSFLKNKFATVDLRTQFNLTDKILTVDSSSLKFDKSTVNLKASFDLKKEGAFQLDIRSASMNVEEGKTIVTQRLSNSLQKFKIDKPIQLMVLLKGKFIPGNQPEADVEFTSTKAEVAIEKIHLSDMTFSGMFTNHASIELPNNDNNSKVTFPSFAGYMGGFPIKGTVEVSQLQNPFIDLHITTEMQLSEMNSHVDTTLFLFTKGSVVTKIDYAGRLSEYVDNTRTFYEGELHGASVVKDGHFIFKPRKLRFDKMDAQFEFNKKNFLLKNLAFTINGSPVKINGEMQNFVPFFIQPKDKGFIKLNVYSPKFDLTPFATAKVVRKKTARQQKKERKKVSDLMDSIFEKLEFDLQVSASQLTFKQFKATDFSGKLVLSHHTLQAKPVVMKVAGGLMNLNFKLSDLSKPINPMEATAKITNARIKDLFTNFNNFNQNAIRDKNLAGNIFANVEFYARVDDNLNVIAPSMVSNLDFIIRKGKLKDFEPLENMSKFLFRKRDFSDVDFAELKSRLHLKGSDLDIHRMEIQSSVLSFFVHGRYSFKDSTSLSVQLPLSNLKRRDKNYKPKNVGVDAKIGPSVFLHIYKDETGKIAIAYDPFKKWAKR